VDGFLYYSTKAYFKEAFRSQGGPSFIFLQQKDSLHIDQQSKILVKVEHVCLKEIL